MKTKCMICKRNMTIPDNDPILSLPKEKLLGHICKKCTKMNQAKMTDALRKVV